MKKYLDVALLLFLFAATAIYCGFLFGGFEPIGDGNDYAGLARNIVAGKGFQLGHVYPLGLAFNPNVPQPNNMWAPGYPVYLAAWFGALGVSDSTAITAAVFAVWLFILAGYLLGLAVGGRWMASMTAALCGLSQVVLYSAIEGTPEILSAAFLTFSVLLILENPLIRNIVLSGVLFGIAFLIRYQMAIVAIPLALIFFHRRGTALAAWALAALAATLPWLIRNWIVLGNPLFTLQTYGEFAKGMGRFNDYYYVYRSFVPMPLWYVATHLPFDLGKKFVGGLIFFAGAFPLRLNFLGVVPFIFGILRIGQVRPVERRMILFAFVAAASVIAISSLDGHHDRHLLPLQACIAVAMLIGFKCLLDEIGAARYKVLVIALGALLFLPSRAPFIEMRLNLLAERYRTDKIGYAIMGNHVEPEAVVVSDASDAIWWYGERNSIWIPATFEDLKLLLSLGRCDYVHLLDVSAFFNALSEEEAGVFAGLVQPVDEFPGPGELFRVLKEERIPDSYAIR